MMALFVVVVLVVGAGYWRLSSGPVSLSVLVGTIENMINDNVDGLTVSINDVVLEKDSDSGALQFRFIDLKVRDPENKLVARTSRAAFRLSLSDLADGELSLTHLELLGPRMFVHRRSDGSFRLGFGVVGGTGKSNNLPDNNANLTTGAGGTAPSEGSISNDSTGSIENAEDLIALLQATLLSDNNKGPTARLREIKVIGAELTLYDEPNATTWISPNANVTMTRAKDGLTADVDAEIKVGQEAFSLNVQADYIKSTQRVKINVSVDDVKPETLARHVPYLEMLKIVRLPVSGSATAEIALDGKMLNAELDINLGAGKLVFTENQEDDIGVSTGNIALRYDQEKRLLIIEPSAIDLSGGKASLSGYLTPEGDSGNPFSYFGYNLELANIKIAGKKTIEIDRIIAVGTADSDSAIINMETTELHAGEARIRVSGTVKVGDKAPDLKLIGNIENIATTKLLEIWPLEVARGLRAWIDESLVAFVPNGNFEIDLDEKEFVRLIDGGDVPTGFLNGEFEARDATVRYFAGLPPLRQAYGKGVLKDAEFNFYGQGGVATVASGKKVKLTRARFFTNWAKSDPAIGIVEATVKGPASAVMELLDNDPLNFGKKMGINPKTMGGNAVGDLKFTMPLLADLPIEKVDIKAKARLTDIKIPKAFGDYDVTRGNLELDITMFGLKGAGTIELKGTKASLVWIENFGVRGKRSSEFRLKARLDDAARKRLGVELSTFMSGPADVSFILKGSGTDLNQAQVVADLTRTTLFRKPIGWISPGGEKASASLRMKFKKGGAIDIEKLEVISKARKIFVAGKLSIDKQGDVSSFNLPDIRLGPLNLYSANGNRSPSGSLNVEVRGTSFDARPIIENALKRDKKTPGSTKKNDKGTVRISASFDKVYAFNKQVFKNFTTKFTSVGDSVVEIKTSAVTGSNRSFRFDFGETAGSPYNLIIASKDAGATLKAFNLYSKVQQGRLVLQAKISPAGSDRPSSGNLKIKQFNIANDDRLKGLTQLVVNNDEQIEEIFRDSVSFSSFKMPFRITRDQLVIGDSILKGVVLGASGRGVIDTRTNGLNIEGTLIPIYAVNSIVGNIPLLGTILVGRKGEGIFGVTFSLRGTTAKPRFSINPASVLAPGFLRQFFERATPVSNARTTNQSGPQSLRPRPRKKPATIVEGGEN